MRKKKWNSPDVPVEILALKLTEEVGEVANVITDAHFNPNGLSNPVYLEHLVEELEHVEFLAVTLRTRIEGMRDA